MLYGCCGSTTNSSDCALSRFTTLLHETSARFSPPGSVYNAQYKWNGSLSFVPQFKCAPSTLWLEIDVQQLFRAPTAVQTRGFQWRCVSAVFAFTLFVSLLPHSNHFCRVLKTNLENLQNLVYRKPNWMWARQSFLFKHLQFLR